MAALICIRQLPYSESTVRFGGLVATIMKSPITLMTVIKSEQERPLAAEQLESARALLDGSAAITKIRYGEATEEILLESREQAYDVIVIGSHELGGLLDSLVASITDKVADRAGACVLVVTEGRGSVQKILIPIGGQQMNRAVVEAGARLARRANASVTILYITDPVPSMYTGLDAIEETLEELLQTDTPVASHLRWSARYLNRQGITAELKMIMGVASYAIPREARQGDYDLIVMGARVSTGPFRRLLIDQVTPHVVAHAPCPVLIVR
jgi:nucleotide-binding universal stress UspA family protein